MISAQRHLRVHSSKAHDEFLDRIGAACRDVDIEPAICSWNAPLDASYFSTRAGGAGSIFH